MDTTFTRERCLACGGQGRIPYYPRPITEYDFMPEFMECAYCCGTGSNIRLLSIRSHGATLGKEVKP